MYFYTYYVLLFYPFYFRSIIIRSYYIIKYNNIILDDGDASMAPAQNTGGSPGNLRRWAGRSTRDAPERFYRRRIVGSS